MGDFAHIVQPHLQRAVFLNPLSIKMLHPHVCICRGGLNGIKATRGTRSLSVKACSSLFPPSSHVIKEPDHLATQSVLTSNAGARLQKNKMITCFGTASKRDVWIFPVQEFFRMCN